MTLKNHIQLQLSMLLGALALIVSGCSSNDPEVIPSEDASLAMLFGSDVSATRAMINSTEDLQNNTDGFGVYGSKDKNELFKNQQVKWNSASSNTDTKWEYTPIKYWDQSTKVTYDFGAYAPYKASGVSSTDNKFTVTGIPQWQKCDTDDEKTAAYDFLVADNRTGNYKNNDFTNGIVDFKFKHKLAKVVISITKEESETLKDITYTVKNVTLGGNGTASNFGSGDRAVSLTADQNAQVPAEQNRSFTRSYLATDAGTDVFSTPTTFADGITLYEDATGLVVPLKTYATITTYLVTPFELATGLTMPITVTYTTMSGDEVVSPDAIPSVTSLNGFEPGMVYNIKLKVGAVNVTAAVIEIQKWTDGGGADDDVYNW